MKRTLVPLLLAGMFSAAAWAAGPAVDVYKSPYCGCCGQWVEHMKASGFEVRTHDTEDVAQHKKRLGVPLGLGSCHTAEVAGYLVEGHVPADDVRRLLKERPKARGLVVPGMPAGSPGMEQGARKDRYEVLLVNTDGSTRNYARH